MAVIAGGLTTIRVLFVEDNPDDVALELRSLREAGFAIEHRTVETPADVRAALHQGTWDLIISDYQMPELSGLDALTIAKALAPTTPFILVSGTVGEDVAVEAMRAGAEDYVLKGDLTRLPSAVKRELREAEARKAGLVSQRGLRLFADVGSALGQSLDLRALVSHVPGVVLRDFAELCTIDLLGEDGSWERAASAQSDPSKEATLRGLENERPAKAFGDIARVLGLPSVVSVPLLSGDRQIGAIHLARRLSYSPPEVRVLEQLAARITVSIENARLYERAQAAVRIRDEFLSVASHELRTPLTALQLQIEGLRDVAQKKSRDWPDDRFPSRLDRSIRNLERLRQLVDGLLDVSRLSARSLHLSTEEVDLVAVAREVVDRFSEEAHLAGCEVRLGGDAHSLGWWDRIRLDQVLTNLVSNAIKYGTGKPIDVEVRERGGDAVLKVIDRGIGIPSGDLERIFGRFERTVSPGHYGGLGLGLFITRQIVEAHGGTITAHPTPSGGATFTVVLPRAPAVARGAVSAKEGGRAETASGPRAAPGWRGSVASAHLSFSFLNEVRDYAIYMMDPDGRILTWNEGARAIKGYTAEEIVGESFARFFSKADRARGKPASLLARAAAEGRAEDAAWRVRKDGSRFWAEVVITSVHDEDGRLRGFVKVTRDMTGRRHAEELLRQSEERLRLLVESVKDYAIFMLDPGGTIATWNSGAERINGYRADEVIGKHFSIFYPATDIEAGRPERELRIARAEGRYEEEGWRIRKNGDRFWASVVLTAIHAPAHGELRGFAKVTRDLTERRRLQQETRSATQKAIEAQTALQARDEFISVAAHELRTPLTALQLKIQGITTTIQNGQVGKAAQRVEGALRQVERLAELVERLLDVSRMARGRLMLAPEETDLTAVVGQVVEDFREPASQAGSPLRFNHQGSVVGIWDRARLEQVVVNLLSNAIKYGAGKEIDVAVESGDNSASLVVTDRGIGIPSEDIPRIFTRFERAAPVQHYGGLGLGLYVARNIVEVHGGTIEVSSRPGLGSTFTVQLPLRTRPQSTTAEPMDSPP